jgi:hypothetical protein
MAKQWFETFARNEARHIEKALVASKTAIDEYDELRNLLDDKRPECKKLDEAASEIDDIDVDFRRLTRSLLAKTDAFAKRIAPLKGLAAALKKAADGSAAKPASKPSPAKAAGKSAGKKKAATKSTVRQSSPQAKKKPATKSKRVNRDAQRSAGVAKGETRSGGDKETKPATKNPGAIDVVRELGVASTAELAKRIGKSVDATGALMRRLEKKGFVRRATIYDGAPGGSPAWEAVSSKSITNGAAAKPLSEMSDAEFDAKAEQFMSSESLGDDEDSTGGGTATATKTDKRNRVLPNPRRNDPLFQRKKVPR